MNAMSYFTMYSYNFCWPVRTLRVPDINDRWRPRTPAMAAAYTGDGDRLDRSYLVFAGMAESSCCSIIIGHKAILQNFRFYTTWPAANPLDQAHCRL